MHKIEQQAESRHSTRKKLLQAVIVMVFFSKSLGGYQKRGKADIGSLD